MDYYNGEMMNGNYWGWGTFMMFFCLLFLIILAVVIIRFLKSHDHHSNLHNKIDPIDIAKERYAKGEITKEEFEQLKEDLVK